MKSFTNFRFDVDPDGIALAVWDIPGRSMNVISIETIAELAEIVERIAGDAAVKGCVIASGKDSFSGGADLAMLQGLADAFDALRRQEGEAAAIQNFFESSRQLSKLYR